jgi:hypothetical protein
MGSFVSTLVGISDRDIDILREDAGFVYANDERFVR